MPAASYHPHATVLGVGMSVYVRPGAGAGHVAGAAAEVAVPLAWHAASTGQAPVSAETTARWILIGFSTVAGVTKIHLKRIAQPLNPRMINSTAGQDGSKLVVAITGSSGMIGSAARRAFEARGHTVKRLVRRAASAPGEIAWNPTAEEIDPRVAAQLEGVDVVINMAGENLAQRWTSGARRRIVDSRVPGTLLLSRTLAALDRKPRVMISGSAMGIYGDRGDELLDESSTLGDGFLASVCKDWEAATSPASEAGIRVVTSRTTLVLDRHGGAFPQFLLQFRLWAGGRLGSGGQWMSWITLRDVVGVFSFLIEAERVSGPVNVVAPEPVTNAEFVRVLGRVLHRPVLLPVPTVALELVFGQMARDTVLASQRVVSRKLGGYRFEDPELEQAIREVISR